jgi:hypothetical protein
VYIYKLEIKFPSQRVFATVMGKFKQLITEKENSARQLGTTKLTKKVETSDHSKKRGATEKPNE